MRAGWFPGQEEALRRRVDELVEEKASERTAIVRRRAFFGAAVAGIAGAGVGRVWSGGAVQPDATPQAAPEAETPAPRSQEHAWARALAEGDVRLLRQQAGMFLTVIEHNADDGLLWQGVLRLGLELLGQDGAPTAALRRRLAFVLENPSAPRVLGPLRDRLR